MSPRTRALAVAAVPFAVAIAVFLICRPRVPLGGDEPHYLIIADSVFSDGDLNLRNNYYRDSITRRIYGPVVPHVHNVPHGWMPAHMAGLGILLAIPLGLFGVVGARVAMISFAAVIPFVLMRWMDERVPARLAAWTAIGLTLAYSFVFDAAQIYPDLPGGAIVLAAAIWLIRRHAPPGRRPWAWAVFWFVAGAMPWLHVKYLGTTAVLVAAGLIEAWRERRPGARLNPAWLAPLAAIGVVSFLAFNQWAFTKPLGPKDARELSFSISRVMEMFLGLHFDQSQGMFFQNPLLLAGVALFAAFARLRPRAALFWIVLYASAIAPNSIEVARFGGGGAVGRFGWTAAWLWTIPIGVMLRRNWPAFAAYIKPAVVISLVYQAALAARWLRAPLILFPNLNPPRDSPFPDVLRPWLPSFYFWDFTSYWTFVPNIVAMAVFVAIAVAGTRVPVGHIVARREPSTA